MASETGQWIRVDEEGDRQGLRSPSSIAERDEETLSFATFLAILLTGRRTILLSGLGMLVLAAIFAFLLPNTYSATTSFIPPGSSGNQSAAALMGQLSALGGASLLGGKSQGDLFVGILKSHTIAHYLVEHFDLKKIYKVKKESVAEKILVQNSLFESGVKDPIVTITVTDSSAERARDLANGYLSALQETSADLAVSESSQRRLFFEQRLAKEKDDLANAEVALKQAQEKSGLISPQIQTSSGIQVLAQLNNQISTRQAQLAALRSDETEQNPNVIRLRSEIGNLQAQVRQLQVGDSKDSFGRFSTAQVPGLELEYIRRARDVKYHEALFDIISKQYEAARLDEAKDSPLQVLDHAIVPDTKSGPHRSIIMAVGLLAGLLMGGALVLFQHARRSAKPAV
jgi:tyrosine-protein kinase Etk/Wzc